jgi:tetratricopeptide (TPR) repeat protein
LAYLRLEQGAVEEAIADALAALSEGRTQGEQLVSSEAELVLAEARLLQGNLDAAEATLSQVNAEQTKAFTSQTWGGGLRAKLLLAQGRVAEAAQKAEEVLRSVRAARVYDRRHASLLLTRAEALFAAGERSAAHAAIREARDDLLTRAAKIEAPSYRQSFLTRVPTHARTLALAREWLGEEAGNPPA